MKKADHEFHADSTTRHSVKDALSDILKMAIYILESDTSPASGQSTSASASDGQVVEATQGESYTTDQSTCSSANDGQVVETEEAMQGGSLEISATSTTVSESFVDPLIKGMQKVRSGWLREFLSRDEFESEIESEDGNNILTADEINFELHYN